jgi:hypothetical protein
VEGLSEEEKKLMQAYVKEQQEGGGKWKKKNGAAVAKAVISASNNFYTGFPGWNHYQQPMAPNLQQQYSVAWQQLGLASTYASGGQYAGLQGAGGQGNMREDKKVRFPCNNCGELGHWKYQPMCPYYNKHLEAMQQRGSGLQSRARRTGSDGSAGREGSDGGALHRNGNQDTLAMVQANLKIAGQVHNKQQQRSTDWASRKVPEGKGCIPSEESRRFVKQVLNGGEWQWKLLEADSTWHSSYSQAGTGCGTMRQRSRTWMW